MAAQVQVDVFHANEFFFLKVMVNLPGIRGREVLWTDLHIWMITLDADEMNRFAVGQ